MQPFFFKFGLGAIQEIDAPGNFTRVGEIEWVLGGDSILAMQVVARARAAGVTCRPFRA